LVTGAIAHHCITCRAPEGERDTVRPLFGCIVVLFCLRVRLVDILGLI
jgi:hypothetical protein